MCEGSCMEKRTPILPPGGNPQARKVKVPPSTFLNDIQMKDQTLLTSLTRHTNPSLRYQMVDEAMKKEYNRKRGKAITFIPYKEGISQYGEVDPEYHIKDSKPQDYYSYIEEFYGGSDYEVAEQVAEQYQAIDLKYLQEIENIFNKR